MVGGNVGHRPVGRRRSRGPLLTDASPCPAEYTWTPAGVGTNLQRSKVKANKLPFQENKSV